MRDTSLASRARSLIRKKSSRTPRVPAAPLAPPDVPDDLETLITIAKLNLEDIDQVTNSRKGKGKEGSLPSHEEMAYQVQQEELTEHLRYLEGIRSAHSLDKVVATNRACLAAIIEAAESEDRRAAELLFCGQPLPPPSALQRRMADPTFSFLPEVKEEDRALGGAVGQKQLEIPLKFPPLELKDESDHQREWMKDIDPDEQYLLQKMVFAKGFRAGREMSSDGAGPSGIHREDHLVECTACGEALKTEEFEILHSPCGHILCRECVQRFIELFTGDESLYPLRCCGTPIPLDSVFTLISPSLRKAFEEKNVEYTALAKDRVYCVNPSCSSFLGSGEGKSPYVGVACPACKTSTCSRAGGSSR